MSKRHCPLCDKEVSASKIGTHLLSSVHNEELATYRPGDAFCPGGNKEGYATACKERVAEKRMINIYTKQGMVSKMFVCFGCNTARDKDDLDHFKKHPSCLELHKKRVDEFLTREVKSIEQKNCETEMRLKRLAETNKQMWSDAVDEFSEYKELVTTFLGFKGEDGDVVELSDLKAFMEQRQSRVWTSDASEKDEKISAQQEEIEQLRKSLADAQKALQTSLEGKKTVQPAPSLGAKPSPTTFQPRVSNFPSREVPKTQPPKEEEDCPWGSDAAVEAKMLADMAAFKASRGLTHDPPSDPLGNTIQNVCSTFPEARLLTDTKVKMRPKAVGVRVA